MSRRITPTASQKRGFFIHLCIFIIGVIIMVLIHHKQGEHHWAYPWHAWIIAAWALSLLGHGCTVYTNYEDKGMKDYKAQEKVS